MSIDKRPDGRYRARYRDPGGHERSKHFARKTDAARWESEMKVAVSRGNWIDPALARTTVGEMALIWLGSKAGLKKTSRTNYEVLWRVHLEPRWGTTALALVTTSAVTVWAAELVSRGLSASWIRQALIALRQILDLAVEDGRLIKNVASQAKGPRLSRRSPRFLTHDQLADLAAACGERAPQDAALILLAGLSGLRWGELRALRLRHLDMLHCRLQVEDNLPSRHRANEVVTPKSHQRRTVAFPRHVGGFLEVCLQGKSRDDFVFATPQGSPLDLSNWRRHVFDPAVTRLRLGPLTPHDLRHTAASLAVSAGADVKVVQRMLGHASAAMTLDVYAGLFADDLDRVADLMDTHALAAKSRRHDASPTTVVSIEAHPAVRVSSSGTRLTNGFR